MFLFSAFTNRAAPGFLLKVLLIFVMLTAQMLQASRIAMAGGSLSQIRQDVRSPRGSSSKSSKSKKSKSKHHSCNDDDDDDGFDLLGFLFRRHDDDDHSRHYHHRHRSHYCASNYEHDCGCGPYCRHSRSYSNTGYPALVTDDRIIEPPRPYNSYVSSSYWYENPRTLSPLPPPSVPPQTENAFDPNDENLTLEEGEDTIGGRLAGAVGLVTFGTLFVGVAWMFAALGCCEDDTNGIVAITGGLGVGTILLGAGTIATTPFWGPRLAMGDHTRIPGYFPRYPYEDRNGFIAVDPDSLDGLKTWSASFRTDYFSDFDSIQQINGRFLYDTKSRFGFDTEWKWLEEKLDSRTRDQMWMGDANIVYRFAQSEHWQMRTGVGVNWMHTPYGTDTGFNFTYGADFFPRKPWIFSSTIDWGTIGHAELFHFRTSAGVLLKNTEIFIGYDYLDIDRIHIDGMVGGLRLWF